jgi:hypothetical protein
VSVRPYVYVNVGVPGAADGSDRAPGARVPSVIWATWERKQWATLVDVLLLIIIVLLFWPKAPDHIVIRVVDRPKVYSTQVVPLR